jgi:hypothetical protein
MVINSKNNNLKTSYKMKNLMKMRHNSKRFKKESMKKNSKKRETM